MFGLASDTWLGLVLPCEDTISNELTRSCIGLMAGEFDEWVVGLAEEAAEDLIRRAPSVFDVSRMLAVVVSVDNALLFL